MKAKLLFWFLLFFATIPMSCQRSAVNYENRGSAIPSQKEFNVVETTIKKVHQAFRDSTLTAEELVEIYLERIKRYDQSTGLNAITDINEAAIETARNLDDEFRLTGELRPLHGIPVIVKENISTVGLQTTAGSLALKGFMPKEDAVIIKKLKEAGAIILGKSNMAEWGINANVTISSVAGETLNPYNLQYTTAGSSGGTAAAIAANFAVIGIGTDTGGSIRGPASHNAIVGVRPSMGLTSRKGIIPLNLRNDVPGPMARTTEDAARVLEVINGYDPLDPLTEFGKDKLPETYAEHLQKNALKGVRIGVFRKLSNYASPEIDTLFQEAIDDLKRQGAIIVDPFEVAGFDSLRHNQWCAVFQDDLNDFLSALGEDVPVKSLREVIESGKYSKYIENDLINYQQYLKVQGETVCGGPFSDTKRVKLRNAIEQAMNRQNVDALIYPSWNRPPIKAGTIYAITGDNNHIIAPHTGQPAVTVPMGFLADNLPSGIQFLGRIFEDHKILNYAYAYEKATQHRKAPKKFPQLKDVE